MGTSTFSGPIVSTAGLKPGTFTVATVPSAAANTGVLIHVSNGAAGSSCLAFSNGTNWLQVAIGSAISAT